MECILKILEVKEKENPKSMDEDNRNRQRDKKSKIIHPTLDKEQKIPEQADLNR